MKDLTVHITVYHNKGTSDETPLHFYMFEKEDRDAEQIAKAIIKCMDLQRPHTCPVCGGNGNVPNGFYRQVSGQWSTSDATPEKCKSCNGLGYIIC